MSSKKTPTSIDTPRKKIFRDPVHGYIEIKEDFVADFVDDPVYQRLKRIQQTNLSVLFPAATNTRFEHSLGVYHIGKILLDSLQRNSERKFANFCKKTAIENTVHLACLLHDVGHSPMSHAGECFYDKTDIINRLKINGFPNSTLQINTDKCAEHELMSCLIGRKYFKKKLSKYNVDLDLLCTMILGGNYNNTAPDYLFKNIIVKILNSSFDADKMDYIIRDSASAGLGAINIDLYRIANSMSAQQKINDEHRLTVKKSAFSVINNIVTSRNYLFYWVYGHHKVRYDYYLSSRYIRAIKEHYPNIIKKFFSYEAITGEVELLKPFKMRISYIDDSDLLVLMKNAGMINPNIKVYYDQYFKRKHFKVAWKTELEYDSFFKSSDAMKEKKDRFFSFCYNRGGKETEERFRTLLNSKGKKVLSNEFFIFPREFKEKLPANSENIYFEINDKVTKTYSEIFPESPPMKALSESILIFAKNATLIKEILDIIKGDEFYAV